jgi:hypothetical protein
MVKYKLAANAMRDRDLLALLQRALPHQPKEVAEILRDAIDAAESVDVARIRTQSLAAIEELRRKGPGSKRDVAWWGQAGEYAISGGCMAAAPTGQVQLGIPCVVGGALTSAALRFWAGQ